MEEVRKTTWQKVQPWLIAFSAIPSFLVIMVFVSIVVYGIWSVILGYGFFQVKDAMAAHPFYADIVQTFAMFLSVVGVTWIYWVAIQKNPVKSIGFERGRHLFSEIFLGLATGVVLLCGTFAILLLAGQIEISGVGFDGASLLKYAVIFILVGFHEELLTRGYFLGTFMKLSNKYVALALVAILFSLMHIGNNSFTFVPFVNLFLAGLLLGIVYIHTRRLWFSIALHMIWNFLQGPVLGSMVSGNEAGTSIVRLKFNGSTLMTGGEFGFESSLVMTALMILMAVALDLFFRRKAKKELQPAGAEN